MLNYALIAFAIAAVGGLLLAASVLRNRLAPWALSVAPASAGSCATIPKPTQPPLEPVPKLCRHWSFTSKVCPLGSQ